MDKFEVVKYGGKSEVILLFAEGIKPKEIYSKGLMSKKTCYKYYKIYNDLKREIRTDAFVNRMVKLLYKLKV